MKQVIDRFNRVAKLNEECFNYSIKIDVASLMMNKIVYIFEVDDSEGHNFLHVAANSLDLLETVSNNKLKDACEDWGYEFCE